MAETPTEAPDEVQDTPEAPEDTAEAPSEEPTTPEIPEGYIPEDRYTSLQAETTRRNQALMGQLGEDAQAEEMARLGWEFAGDDEDDEDDLPPDPDERIEKLEQQLAERAEREEQEKFEHLEEQYLEGKLGEVAKAFDRDLADEEVEIIISYALANRHEDGRPDVEGGQQKLETIYSNAQERLIKPKRNAPKPGKGTAGAEKIDTSTAAGRRAAITTIAAEHEAAAD